MSSGSQNLPLIRLENRVEQLKRAVSITSDDTVNVTASSFYKVITTPIVVSTTPYTMLAADIINGLIQATTGSSALTFPTGTLLDAALPINSPIGTSFQCTITNGSGGTITVASATGLTFQAIAVNIGTFSNGSSRTYLFRKTGTNTFDVYTLSLS